MLFCNLLHGKPFGLQTIVGTENVSFLFCKCLAYHREYLTKQLTTLHLGVGKASSQSLFACMYARLFINNSKIGHKITHYSPKLIRND